MKCPRCGHEMEAWIRDWIEFGRRSEGPVPHDHIWTCPECGHQVVEAHHEDEED